MKISFLLLIILISCSDKNSGSGKVDKTPRITLEPILAFTNDTDLFIKAQEIFFFDSIYFYKNDNSCDTSSKISEVDAEDILDHGEYLPLEENQINTYYYSLKVDDFQLGCRVLGQVTHDNISPLDLTFPAELTASTYKENTQGFHPPINSVQDNSIYYVAFYSDPFGLNEIKKYRIEDWNSSIGFIDLVENSTNLIYFSGLDRSLNKGSIFGPIRAEHDNTPPSKPILTANTLELHNSVVSNSSINLQGTVDSDTVSVEIFTSLVLETPLLSITEAQLNGGYNLNLNTENSNYFYITAKDEFGNLSEPEKLTIYHTNSPNYVYDLYSTEYPLMTGALKSISYSGSFSVRNKSRETTFDKPVDVATLSYVSSNPALNVDMTDCTGVLEGEASCNIRFDHSFNTVGVHVIEINITLNGSPIKLISSVEVKEAAEKIYEGVISTNSITSFVSQGSSYTDISKRYFVTDKGLIKISDGAFTSLNNEELNLVKNAMVSNGTLYASSYADGVKFFGLQFKNIRTINLGTGNTVSNITSENVGGDMVFSIKTINDEYFLIVYDAINNIVISNTQYSKLSNLIKINNEIFIMESNNKLRKVFPTEETHTLSSGTFKSSFLINYNESIYTISDNGITSDILMRSFDMSGPQSDLDSVDELLRVDNRVSDSLYIYRKGTDYSIGVFSSEYIGNLYTDTNLFSMVKNQYDVTKSVKVRNGTNDVFIFKEDTLIIERVIANPSNQDSIFIRGKNLDFSILNGNNFVTLNALTQAVVNTQAIPDYDSLIDAGDFAVGTAGGQIHRMGISNTNNTETVFTVTNLKALEKVELVYFRDTIYALYINSSNVPIILKLNI